MQTDMINYLTYRAKHHLLSRQCITLVPTALMQYLALTARGILPYRLDNIIVSISQMWADPSEPKIPDPLSQYCGNTESVNNQQCIELSVVGLYVNQEYIDQS